MECVLCVRALCLMHVLVYSLPYLVPQLAYFTVTNMHHLPPLDSNTDRLKKNTDLLPCLTIRVTGKWRCRLGSLMIFLLLMLYSRPILKVSLFHLIHEQKKHFNDTAF